MHEYDVSALLYRNIVAKGNTKNKMIKAVLWLSEKVQ